MAKSKCECGKTKSQYAGTCVNCYKTKMEKHYAKAKAIVATGKCPTCGLNLKRNNSMTGWWQCEQLGAENFRKYPEKSPCDFQTFTS